MLEGASDEALLELADYILTGQNGDSQAEDDTESWLPNKLRAFCSHISAHKELVSQVKAELAGYHIDCFVAHEDIEPSKHWLEIIQARLRSCDLLLAFLTDGFHESNWTDQEVGFCVARSIPILPIKCGIDPYGFISSIQAIRAGDRKPVPIANAVLHITTTHPAIIPAMTKAVVEGFIASNSYSVSKSGVHALGKLPHICEEDLQRIESAVQANEQIYKSFGVPDRARAIIARHRKREA